MTPDRGGRTFIGTVVCIDLVGYSTRSVEQQGAIKAHFNRLLVQALAGVRAEDRAILDIGDGAAVTFMGDPEQVLRVAIDLRRVMAREAATLGAPGGAVRMGVTLGSVKLGTDLNGRPKLVGDALNVAQGLLAFAKPGQVVVARPFYEVVASLSEENAALFMPLGWRKDADGREHEIRALVGENSDPAMTVVATDAGKFHPGTRAAAPLLRHPRLLALAAAILLGILVLGTVLYVRRNPGTPPATTASAPSEPASATATPAPATAIPAPATATSVPPAATPTQPVAVPPAAETVKPRIDAALPERVPEKPLPRKPPEEAKAVAPVVPPPRANPPARADANPPVPLHREPVEFPIDAARRKIERGVVRARLTIDAVGGVRQVEVLESRPGRIFDNEALRALALWRFAAGAEGRTLEVEIEFKR